METEEATEDLVDSDTENNNQILETDAEILLGILPSNVWAYTFKKLEKKHPSSLENLSNSSLYFRNVTLSKRVLFLFPQVVKLIGPQFANEIDTKIDGSNIIRSRIICKQWNKAVDQFIIDGTLDPDFFFTSPPQPSDHALVNARFQYFGHVSPTKLREFLSHFQETHLPHNSRNPFIGKGVYIDLTGFTDPAQWTTIADHVLTLLRKYGHHIKILNIGSFIYHHDRYVRWENHVWLLECLGHCPNVTHLKVSERFNPNGEIDVSFGERPDPRRRPADAPIGYLDDDRLQFIQMREHLERAMMPGFMGRPWELLPLPVRPPGENRMEGVLNLMELAPRHHFPPPRHPRPERDQVQPIWNANPHPMSTLNSLRCLKLCQLTFLNFNALLSANTHVVWLQVESLTEDKRRYIDYHSLELPNLKKLYIKLCCPEEVRKLRGVHQSWLQLTHLHFEYCKSEMCCFTSGFIEWIEVFGVISEKWGNTLTDLKLRLPMARREEDRKAIARDSEFFRLYLPKLKRLKIWLSERPNAERVAKMDFLDLCRVWLDQLILE